jgi:YidC/Oxa1 family membrane protein insertase
MNPTRLLLLSTSAMLTLLLLIEWNEFSAEQSVSNAADRFAISDQPSSTASLNSTITGTDSLEPNPADDSDDIPTVIQPSTDTPTIRTVGRSLIDLTTDSLDLTIDLRGGDIVRASLPKFLEQLDNPDEPFLLLEDNTTRTYVAQSGLIGPDGIDGASGRADYRYVATNIDPENNSTEVTLNWTGSSDLDVQKIFTAYDNHHYVDVAFQVTNNGSNAANVTSFAQLKRDNSPAPDSNTGFGMQPFLGVALTQPEDRYTKFDFNDIADEPFSKQLEGGWIAVMQHYFVSAWIPNQTQSHYFFTRKNSSGDNVAGFTNPATSIAPGESVVLSNRLYIGPKDQPALAELADYLDLVIDYGFLWWIAKPLFWLLTQIQALVVNWGAAIILLTILVKAAFFQLSAAGYRSMAKMRTVQPKIQAVRNQYADDRNKLNQAMMDLWKKEKINPMGGCLPLLIQMPVFLALYWVLMESVELRHAPFVLWITDLSAMDPYFVLPILMGISMYLMQSLNPAPPDPIQAKIMQYMPIAFTFLMLWFPAGLVLYWLCNNVLSFAQQYVITRQIEKQAG